MGDSHHLAFFSLLAAMAGTFAVLWLFYIWRRGQHLRTMLQTAEPHQGTPAFEPHLFAAVQTLYKGLFKRHPGFERTDRLGVPGAMLGLVLLVVAFYGPTAHFLFLFGLGTTLTIGAILYWGLPSLAIDARGWALGRFLVKHPQAVQGLSTEAAILRMKMETGKP